MEVAGRDLEVARRRLATSKRLPATFFKLKKPFLYVFDTKNLARALYIKMTELVKIHISF
jgi:hypothetical protein